MGYSIAYNSGSTTPFGTFKQGTITMGLKPQEYTVSSGFTWYANATTPNDNYLIISDTYSQGWSDQQNSKPTIWRSETGTTESFVSLVNQLPAVNGVTAFTDSGNAIKYLMDSGKYFVSKDDYLGIVSDGLVLNLDAGWYPSYSGSGTMWKDLSNNGNDGTLTNGPTFSSLNGGYLVFDGASDYVTKSNFSGLGSNPSYTMMTWMQFGNLSQGAGIDTNIMWYGGQTFYGAAALDQKGGKFCSLHYADDIVFSSFSPVINTPYHAVMSYDNSSRVVKLYVNGVFIQSGTHSQNLNITSQNLFIGGGPRGWTGKISTPQIYNRVLTDSEILQNYNATKGRFGL